MLLGGESREMIHPDPAERNFFSLREGFGSPLRGSGEGETFKKEPREAEEYWRHSKTPKEGWSPLTLLSLVE